MQTWFKIISIIVLTNNYGCSSFLVGGLAAGAIAIVADSRDLLTVNQDIATRQQLYLQIVNQPGFEHANINLTVHHGVVLLSGQTSNAILKVKAEKIVKANSYVSRVYNEIKIKARVSNTINANDVWITTKVKAALISDLSFKAGSIKVITEDGVVYLLGLVTKKQAKQALNIARRIAGVTKVVKAFRYYAVKEY